MLQILLGLLAISGIGALLALILEIAGSYIANYGEKHVLINEERDLVVQGGAPLLFALMENGIFIPSACGGRGTCAYCKVRVLRGGGPVLPTETPYLSLEEIEGGVRLSCQCKVRENLEIRIPEELFLIREFRTRVEQMVTLTPEIKGIRLRIMEPDDGIAFKPGQYVQLRVPEYELCPESVYRAYSICSSAGRRNMIDLVITRVPGGACSTYVHDYLKVGEELVVNGPYGDFYLRESDREILFVATGSGLAPIKSILHQMEEQNIQRKAALYFGARTRKDLFYQEELDRFERTLEDFTFVPTLSRATDEDAWEGEKGRVTDLIEKFVPEGADIDAYLCGSPSVVESCEALLKKKGVAQDRIYYDKFG